MNMSYHANRILAELGDITIAHISDDDLRAIAKAYCLAAWPNDNTPRRTREVKLFGVLKLRRDMMQ